MIRGIVCVGALLALLFAGCRDESLPGVPVIDARLADMRAVSGVSEAGAGVDSGNAADAAPAGVDAPGGAAGDAVVTAPDAAPGPDAVAAETAAPADGAGVDAADATTAGPATLRRGLVLWLPLDDGPGNLRARDDSGHMNATALRELDPAGAWTPGRFDGALNFPGNAAGGWLRVAPSESLNGISKGLTISAWIKRPAQGDAGGTIVSRQAVGPGGYLYNFQISDNRLRIRLHSGNGYRLDLLGERLVPRDTWSHVLVSYDQTEARLFVDGQLAGNARFGLGLPAENSPLAVGASLTGSNETAADRLLGVLDDLLVYDRALSADEVKALARGQRP
jgi:Concanavalin A-like lectin/glucanases superfamily